jgi:predicted transcriptional regulator
MLNELEKKILEILAKRHLLRKSELKRIFNENGVLYAITSLVEKGFVCEVLPIGEKSYVITQKGKKYLEDNSG